jgi:hypothetical protein
VHIARQRIPQRLGMLGVQVNLVLGAVQRESDSAEKLSRPVDQDLFATAVF